MFLSSCIATQPIGAINTPMTTRTSPMPALNMNNSDETITATGRSTMLSAA